MSIKYFKLLDLLAISDVEEGHIFTEVEPLILSEEVMNDNYLRAERAIEKQDFSARSDSLKWPDHPFNKYWLEVVGLNKVPVDDVIHDYYGVAVIVQDDTSYIAYSAYGKDGALFVTKALLSKEKHKDIACNAFITRCCEEIHHKETFLGVEKTNFRVRVGKGEGRKLHKVNQIVRIVRQKEIEKYAPSNSNQIEWHHCWSVIGHWRQLRGAAIGKDNGGKYNQLGRTWVKPSIKGNRAAPLIKKIRHFVDNKTGNENFSTP